MVYTTSMGHEKDRVFLGPCKPLPTYFSFLMENLHLTFCAKESTNDVCISSYTNHMFR